MHGFHGVATGALWEGIEFDRRHFADIEPPRSAIATKARPARWECAF
jgi:hypothetical protein